MPSAQHGKCSAYVRTIGLNMPPLLTQSRLAQHILPAAVAPSPPFALSVPQNEDDDEELELNNLQQAETPEPQASSPPKKQKTKKPGS